jgi:hypothetical protein
VGKSCAIDTDTAKPGDVVEHRIEGIGTIKTTVRRRATRSRTCGMVRTSAGAGRFDGLRQLKEPPLPGGDCSDCLIVLIVDLRCWPPSRPRLHSAYVSGRDLRAERFTSSTHVITVRGRPGGTAGPPALPPNVSVGAGSGGVSGIARRRPRCRGGCWAARIRRGQALAGERCRHGGRRLVRDLRQALRGAGAAMKSMAQPLALPGSPRRRRHRADIARPARAAGGHATPRTPRAIARSSR